MDWECEMLAAHEENLSPLYSFFRQEDFVRFTDVQGEEGWVVCEYAKIKLTCNRPSIPAMTVVYYDKTGLALIHESRIIVQ